MAIVPRFMPAPGNAAVLPNTKMLPAECDVLFLGFQDNPYQYCHKAQLFLFPSLFEGMPNALAEAFICGAICVSADCKSGPREILSNAKINAALTYPYFELGYLMPVFEKYEPGSPLSESERIWATVVTNLLRGNCPKMDTEAYHEKVDQFNKENILKKWEKAIETQPR